MTKEKTKVKFMILYQLTIIDRIGDIMSKCDLGITGIESPILDIVSWRTSTKVDLKYINKMKRVLKEAYKRIDKRIIKIKKIK